MKDASSTDQKYLCPSSLCREGALLLGIVGSDGKVGYINPAPTVGREFVENARQQARAPEYRFRFAAPCLEAACVRWTGTRCGVIDQATSVAQTMQPNTDKTNSLPKCAVRLECRWFAQGGPSACLVCPYIFNHVRSDSGLANPGK
jgi:hypothetical protein